MLNIFHAGTEALDAGGKWFSRPVVQWLGEILRAINSHGTDIAALDTRLDTAEAFIAADKYAITCILDGGGAAIAAGGVAYTRVPRAGTIQGWEVVADVAGSIVVDVWRDNYANFPPTVAGTIAGTEKPTLSAAQKAQDVALTTWTAGLSAGDYLAFKVESAATATWAAITLIVDPT